VTRDELSEVLTSQGATIQSQVTKKTDLLLVGNNSGRVKYEKALRVGVPIMPWTQFVALGLFISREDPRVSADLSKLSSQLALQLAIFLDGLYAHSITTDTRFRGLYQLGSKLLDRLLYATWGTAIDPDTGELLSPDPRFYNSPTAALEQFGAAWVILGKELRCLTSEMQS